MARKSIGKKFTVVRSGSTREAIIHQKAVTALQQKEARTKTAEPEAQVHITAPKGTDLIV